MYALEHDLGQVKNNQSAAQLDLNCVQGPRNYFKVFHQEMTDATTKVEQRKIVRDTNKILSEQVAGQRKRKLVKKKPRTQTLLKRKRRF